ncbi:MAG: GtrA family protein [Legionella sp.]|nr:GtrA family protein [Legionella sp.]
MKTPRKLLKQQMIGFTITGTLSTLIMFLLYISFNKLMNYQYSYLIAYAISVITLYFMNIRFVFHTHMSLKSFLKFPLIYLFQYLVGAVSIKILVEYGFSITYAPLVVIIILLPITFLLNRIVLIKY